MVFYVAIYATVYFFAIDKVYGLLQMGTFLHSNYRYTMAKEVTTRN